MSDGTEVEITKSSLKPIINDIDNISKELDQQELMRNRISNELIKITRIFNKRKQKAANESDMEKAKSILGKDELIKNFNSRVWNKLLDGSILLNNVAIIDGKIETLQEIIGGLTNVNRGAQETVYKMNSDLNEQIDKLGDLYGAITNLRSVAFELKRTLEDKKLQLENEIKDEVESTAKSYAKKAIFTFLLDNPVILLLVAIILCICIFIGVIVFNKASVVNHDSSNVIDQSLQNTIKVVNLPHLVGPT